MKKVKVISQKGGNLICERPNWIEPFSNISYKAKFKSKYGNIYYIAIGSMNLSHNTMTLTPSFLNAWQLVNTLFLSITELTLIEDEK